MYLPRTLGPRLTHSLILSGHLRKHHHIVTQLLKNARPSRREQITVQTYPGDCTILQRNITKPQLSQARGQDEEEPPGQRVAR